MRCCGQLIAFVLLILLTVPCYADSTITLMYDESNPYVYVGTAGELLPSVLSNGLTAIVGTEELLSGSEMHEHSKACCSYDEDVYTKYTGASGAYVAVGLQKDTWYYFSRRMNVYDDAYKHLTLVSDYWKSTISGPYGYILFTGATSPVLVYPCSMICGKEESPDTRVFLQQYQGTLTRDASIPLFLDASKASNVFYEGDVLNSVVEVGLENGETSQVQSLCNYEVVKLSN